MTSSQDSKGKSRYVWGLREDSLPSGGESCVGFEGLAFSPPLSHREEPRKHGCPLKVGTSEKGTSWTIKSPQQIGTHREALIQLIQLATLLMDTKCSAVCVF